MAEAYPTASDVESASSSDPDYDGLTTSNTANSNKVINRAAAAVNESDDDDDDGEPEQVSVVSLLDDRVFPDAPSMLAHCRDRFGFDFVAVRDRLGLDFHGCVRLINFVRRSVKEGVALPEEITADHLAHDGLLIPVLEDDAMIFCLDELPEPAGQAQGAEAAASGKEPFVEELLQKNAQLQAELEQLAKQFSSYRLVVEQTLDRRWGVDEEGDMAESSKTAATTTTAAAEGGKKDEKEDDDSAYYESYAHNSIHETMLKDAVRTDAYRDFIYTNKHLFAGKVVLDIGCGTGILSMFCARAGAAKVLAVDNSAILDKAREIIFDNGLDHVITCVRGRIEEVTLPVAKVDVIVSEWMGYCLLFEAMLPSVLFARDRYLKPDGLLVPSHASMCIAPVSDPGYVSDQVGFWRDMYGFDMRAMQRDICKDVRVAAFAPNAVRGSPSAFRMLDLHTATVEDLTFEDQWQTTVSEATEALDGFLVWFDIFFGESRQEVVEATATAKEWAAAGRERVAFTTGPYDAETHWKQGLFLLDEKRAKKLRVAPGNKLAGEISYAVPEGRGHARNLNIKITWAVEGGDKSSQTWLLQ